jgi:hypothetical protein
MIAEGGNTVGVNHAIKQSALSVNPRRASAEKSTRY